MVGFSPDHFGAARARLDIEGASLPQIIYGHVLSGTILHQAKLGHFRFDWKGKCSPQIPRSRMSPSKTVRLT